ncbi:hypothetical protein [Nitrosopumilus sp. S4]
MASIIFMAIGIAIASVLLGSVAFSFLTPTDESGLSPLEQKCQLIANEGYKIHSMYPDSNPDELPEKEFNRLMYLDDKWIKECVSVLPADSVFSIVNNVEREFSYGE